MLLVYKYHMSCLKCHPTAQPSIYLVEIMNFTKQAVPWHECHTAWWCISTEGLWKMGNRPQTIFYVSTELVNTDKGGKLLVFRGHICDTPSVFFDKLGRELVPKQTDWFWQLLRRVVSHFKMEWRQSMDGSLIHRQRGQCAWVHACQSHRFRLRNLKSGPSLSGFT